jgi:hypothetical protein
MKSLLTHLPEKTLKFQQMITDTCTKVLPFDLGAQDPLT